MFVTDELLNRVWYAGAYTNQICTIEPDMGNALVHLFEEGFSRDDDQTPVNVTWYNNYTITGGKSALVDGAKRDRLVWAGGILSPPNTRCMLTELCRHGDSRSRCCGVDKRCHLH
jgi:hypothetical protein